MLTLRKSAARGRSQIDWLDSRHTFSFGDYHDPRHMGFRTLRVLNDDRVAPGGGFPPHSHRDMEILSYVLEGALEHEDSLGTGAVIRPGEVQRMTAGTGVTHSEFNASKTEPVHFLQIWIPPEQRGLAPSYEQKAFPESERLARLRPVASRDGREGSVTIHRDADVFLSTLRARDEVRHVLRADRAAWVHVASGRVRVNGETLSEGDGLAAVDERALAIVGADPRSEVLLFDLADRE